MARHIRQDRWAFGLGTLLLAAVLMAASGCVTESKDSSLEKAVSSFSTKLKESGSRSASKATAKAAEESAIPEKSSSPDAKARREAWKAACKAVCKVLVKQYAVRGKPAFGLGPIIQPVGTGRYRVYGYANTRYPNGMLLQRAFDAWMRHQGGGSKCEKLFIDGKRVL